MQKKKKKKKKKIFLPTDIKNYCPGIENRRHFNFGLTLDSNTSQIFYILRLVFDVSNG